MARALPVGLLALLLFGFWRVAECRGLPAARPSARPTPSADQARQTSLGRALFLGSEPTEARIAGHSEPLPPSVVRCVNCHEPAGKSEAAARSGYGPTLGQDSLLRAQARRGGPPSRYDRAAFCRVLRDGIDPASIMIPQTMPRYRIGDAPCGELFAYLSSLR